jgi:hypothetical protein
MCNYNACGSVRSYLLDTTFQQTERRKKINHINWSQIYWKCIYIHSLKIRLPGPIPKKLWFILDANKLKSGTPNFMQISANIFSSNFHSIISWNFLDAMSASMFTIPGTCKLNNQFFWTAHYQISKHIWLHFTDFIPLYYLWNYQHYKFWFQFLFKIFQCIKKCQQF